MNRLGLILNAEGALDPAGWLHLIAFGEVPVDVKLEDGKIVRLTQVYDSDSLSSIVSAFNRERERLTAEGRWAGYLLDWDHDSNLGGSTEAAGWIVEMENRDDGAWARVDWSDKGRQAVTGKRFRFASVVHRLDDCAVIGASRIRPLAISKAALTNSPRNKLLKPYTAEMLNSVKKGLAFNSQDAIERPSSDEKRTQDEGTAMNYKELLCGLIGCNPDATDDEIKAAIDSAKAKMDGAAKSAESVDALNARISELSTELVTRDLADHAAVITNADDIREALMKDRHATLKILRGLKAVAPRTLRNSDGRGRTDDTAERELASKQMSCVQEIINRDDIGFEAAWQKARAEKPELFQIEKLKEE